MRIKLARSARKHKIGKAHVEAALKGEMLLVEDRGNGNGLWIAVDDRGVELEVGMRPATLPERIPSGSVTSVEDVDLDSEVVHVKGRRTRYSEADAEQDSRDADAAFDARRRQLASLVPGGKSLSGDGSQSPVVRARVSAATKAELERRAQEAGMSVSKYTRRLIESHLARLTG